MHWSEFIGGDVVISPPYAWQVRYNASDIRVVPRIDKPVDPKIVDELSKKFVGMFGCPSDFVFCARSRNPAAGQS
jgi:hypothetical protein